MGVLDQILQQKDDEVLALRGRRLVPSFTPRPVCLSRDQAGKLHLLTEIKFRSPSAGPLSTTLSVEQRARAYEAAGASMLSILCDTRFFDGSFEHLTRARNSCELPLLCKEFIIDEVQLDAALAYGADAVLLIVRCLAEERLHRLIVASHERGLTPLVEVHGPSESLRAIDAGADLIGVNARDLDTLSMNAAQAKQVLESLPSGTTALHLSGVHSVQDILDHKRTRADGVLIGEVLMREDDPTGKLSAFAAAARDA